MKIENESISIQIGKKQYIFKNLILNEYLRKMVNSQLDSSLISDSLQRPQLDCLLLKLDDNLEDLDKDSELTSLDFDIALDIGDYNKIFQTVNEQKVEIKYNYTDLEKFRCLYMKGIAEDKYFLNDFYGHKVTALGFCNSLEGVIQEIAVCAVLDTSNYDIYLQEDQKFSVVRKDTITTDCLFYTNDSSIPGPLHLAPYGYFNDNGILLYGILYSIGLSKNESSIDEEKVIKDLDDDDFSFLINSYIKNNDTEMKITFLSGGEYTISEGLLYSNGNRLYPNTSLYPITKNVIKYYNYLILKYKIYDHLGTDTENYYYQVMPIDEFGTIILTKKYERG